LNLLVTPVIAEVEAAAEDLETVTEEVAAEDLEDVMVVVLEATHLGQGQSTDWSWKICLHVHLGRT